MRLIDISFLGLLLQITTTWWLKKTDIYLFTILDAISLKPRFWQISSSGNSEEELIPCLCPVQSVVLLDLQIYDYSYLPLSSYLPTFIPRILVIEFKTHFNPEWSHIKILNLIASVWYFFQIRSHSQVSDRYVF